MNASKPKGKTKREYCSGGKHNPKATHPEKDCWQLNDKSSKPAKAAQAEDSDGSSLISTGNGLCCTIKAMATIKLPNMCYLDSGASTHMFANKSLFKNYRPKSGKVEIADGNTIDIMDLSMLFPKTTKSPPSKPITCLTSVQHLSVLDDCLNMVAKSSNQENHHLFWFVMGRSSSRLALSTKPA